MPQKLFTRFLSANPFREEPNLSLLPVTAFIFGVLTYFNLSFEPSLLSVGALTTVGILLLFIKTISRIRLIILSGVFFWGGLLVCLAHTALNSTSFISQPLLNIALSGKVIAVENHLTYTRFDVKVYNITRLKQKDQLKKTGYPLQKMPNVVRLYGADIPIKEGDFIKSYITALTPPNMPQTPFAFNEARTLWYDGIDAVGSAYRVQVLNMSVTQKKNIFTFVRKRIRQKFLKNLAFDNAGIALALVLGTTEFVSTSSRILYRDLGISHILAVSGFHIGLIAFFVFIVIRFLLNLIFPKLSAILIKRAAVLTVTAICFFYVILSEAHVPAVRAYLMICAVMLAVFLDRRFLSVHNVFFAAFLILCFKPVLLMSVSFQLSFTAVLCITGICSRFQNRPQENNFFYQKIFTFLGGLILFNLAVTFATAPFVLYAFHQLPIFSALCNLILSSIFACAVIPLLFLSVLTLFLPAVSDLFLSCVNFLLSGISFIGMPISAFEHNTLYVSYFHGFGLVLWTIGLIGLSIFTTKIRRVFYLFFLLFPIAFLGIEKPVALIGAGGRFIGFRENNTYYETESYLFKRLHGLWLTYAGLNPEKKHILPLLSSNSSLIGLDEHNCSKALFSIYQNKKMTTCPRLFFPEQVYGWQTLSVFKNGEIYKYRRACETDQFRPWRVACPDEPKFYQF